MSSVEISALTVAWLTGVLFGMWLLATLQAHVERRHRPFHWQCPVEGCGFQVSGTDPGSVERIVTNHERRPH